jgi:NarL family two-component system response regulator LiaR
MNPTRLLIIDDHDDVRAALRARLDALPEIEVVGCTGSWETGLQKALTLEPDVVLLETKRGDGQGLEALQCINDQCSCTDVIVLTSYPDAEERAAARSSGAVRYLLKDIDSASLVSEIQSVTR